jgi:23S rRNA (uracil1939-C5)-methyltransferase
MRGRVESLAYGPHGVVRAGGKVYFVRQTAPGDEIEFEVREEHRSYAFAETTALLEPGETRRQPPCEYLPRCGGCPWQHVTYEAQLLAKERAVGDLLRRVGGLGAAQVLPILRSPREFGYRRRLSLRVEGRRVGYFAGGSHELIPIAHCLLAAPALDGAIPIAEEWVGSLATTVKRIEVAAEGTEDRFVLAAQAEGSFAPADDDATAVLLRRHPRLVGAALRGRGWRRSWGDAETRVSAGGDCLLSLAAGSFVQVNEEANRAMVAVVLDFARCAPADHVLDLYAGFGNLTFPLARVAAQVTAVERDPGAAEAGREHARGHGHERVTFVAGDVAPFLEACVRRGDRYDVVVLDPPRSGAAEAARELLRMRPRRLVYVSCNPSTLARDLRSLAPRYTVGRVQPIDFFPHSYHVETVVELWLTDG